jgi:hypothetical protein
LALNVLEQHPSVDEYNRTESTTQAAAVARARICCGTFDRKKMTAEVIAGLERVSINPGDLRREEKLMHQIRVVS